MLNIELMLEVLRMKFKTRKEANKFLKQKRKNTMVSSDYIVRKVPNSKIWKFTVSNYIEWLNGMY